MKLHGFIKPAALAVLISLTLIGSGFSKSGYILRANDVVKISVFQEEDLTTEARIAKSGFIVFPLLGSLKLSGKTVEDAVAEITQKLNEDFIINPQVTLAVLDYAVERVTVLGQVQKPGAIEIPDEGRLDVLGAIAMAGGYTEIADAGRVTLRRNVGGEEKVYKINAKKLASDKDAKRVYVLPNDTISVGESMF